MLCNSPRGMASWMKGWMDSLWLMVYNGSGEWLPERRDRWTGWSYSVLRSLEKLLELFCVMEYLPPRCHVLCNMADALDLFWRWLCCASTWMWILLLIFIGDIGQSSLSESSVSGTHFLVLSRLGVSDYSLESLASGTAPSYPHSWFLLPHLQLCPECWTLLGSSAFLAVIFPQPSVCT